VYTMYYNYTADTILYFEDASKLANVASSKPLAYINILLFNKSDAVLSFGLWQQPRAFFMAKLVSLLNLFTGNNYWLTGLYLSALSFYGFWRLANTLVLIFPSSRLAAAIGLLLFPSVVFWSSGLIKESIAMACITGSLHLLLSYQFKLNTPHTVSRKIWHGLILLFAAYLVWKLKYYYLAVLLPVYLAYLATVYLLRRFTPIKPWAGILVFLVLFSGILAVATRLHPSLHPDVLLGTIIENHEVTLAASSPEDVIRFHPLQPDFVNFLKNTPLALVSGLFRPFVWEGNTLFQYITGIENLFILFITLLALFKLKKPSLAAQPPVYLLLAATLTYILVLAIVLAFSAPNFGALARYKAGFLPFLLYFIIWAASVRKVNNQ
jgi:hypothetical protein